MPESRVKSFVSFKIATAAAADAIMAAPTYCLLAASAKCPAIVVTLTLSRESIQSISAPDRTKLYVQ